MATHKGSEGVIKVGSDTLGEVKSFSLDHNAGTIQTTTMGDATHTKVAGIKDWSGSIDCFWDETDTAMQTLDAASEVTVSLYPEGTTAGDIYFTGSALITGVSRSASFDGMVEASFTFEGNGDLSESTAT